MASLAFDTYEAVKALKKAGANTELAEAVVATVGNAVGGNVATKDDINLLREEINHLDERINIRIDELEKRLTERMTAGLNILGQRLLIQLGGLMFVLFGLFFALLKMFPPVG